MARKTKEEALRTKQRLLDSAMEVMSEQAYSNISMTEIAERIGYSKGAIYWHFRNKHDILINLIDTSCAMTEIQLSKSMMEQHGLDGLRAYFENKLSVVLQNDRFKMFHKLLHRRQEWPDEVREKVTSILVGRVDKERMVIEKILTDLQDKGEIKKDLDTKDIAGLISAVFHAILIFQIDDTFYHMDFSKHVTLLFGAFEKELIAR